MALTTLDPKTALVVIDLQKGIVGLPSVHPMAEIVERAVTLAAAFRRHGLPVVLVNVTGGAPGRTDAGRRAFAPSPDWSELIPELQAQSDDLRITKTTWGAFHGTPLDAELRARDVTAIVLAGVSTSAGVESTARAAHEHGYNVALAIDAMTDLDAGAHANSVAHIFPRIGEVTTSTEVIAMLDRSSSRTNPTGRIPSPD